MRGYLPASAELKGNLLDSAAEQDLIRELSQRKRSLLLELRRYQGGAEVSWPPEGCPSLGLGGWGKDVCLKHTHTHTSRCAVFQSVSDSDGMGVIPANTQLQTALAVRAAGPAHKAHVELSICTPNGSVSANPVPVPDPDPDPADGAALCLLQRRSSGPC